MSVFFYKPKNRAVSVSVDKSKGIHRYGKNNLFPNELLEKVLDSGTSSSCWDTLSTFIKADGFIEETDFKTVVVKDSSITADDLLDEMADTFSLFRGVALNIKVTATGEVGEVYNLDFETVRKSEKNDFYVVDVSLGTGNKSRPEDVKTYPRWDPKQSPSQRVDIMNQQLLENKNQQLGWIYYDYVKKPGSKTYPVPSFNSGIEDVEADAEMQKLIQELTTEGFMPSAIMTWIGEINRTERDDNGDTQLDRITNTLKQFSGKGGKRGRLALLFAKTKELIPDLKTFDLKSVLESIPIIRDEIGRAVCRHWGVPPVLIGFSTPGQLGNNQEIANILKLFNLVVNPGQRFLQRVFQTIWPGQDWAISTLNPIDFVPNEVLEVMTTDEKRALGGLEPTNTTENAATKTANAISALSPLVANKVLDSMSEAEIRGLAGLETEEEDKIKETLSGEQISQLTAIQEKVKLGQISPEQAAQTLRLAYGISRKRAFELIDQPDPKKQEAVQQPVIP